jgi:hypothetical protein
MVQKPQRDLDETFWRKRILPEEDRGSRPIPPLRNGSYRWFRSPNIVDLWHYRSPAEKRRITDFMWRRQLTTRNNDGALPARSS